MATAPATQPDLQAIRARLHASSEKFTAIQREVSELVSRRKGVEAQIGENSGVRAELAKVEEVVDDEGNALPAVYKLTGPVLLAQETGEAASTVGRRLEILSDERDRLEKAIAAAAQSAEALKGEIVSAQQELNALASTPRVS
ncbi:Prefoldin subunit 6 [Savitreella phatthalungensis]